MLPARVGSKRRGRRSPAPSADESRFEGRRIGLVFMPWGAMSRASIALGILKRCASSLGCEVDVHYLNIRFAEMVGRTRYGTISRRTHLEGEWFFSANLFGDGGPLTGAVGWPDLSRSAAGRELAAKLVELAESEEACLEIAHSLVPRFIDDCVETIDWGAYDVVGFSVTFAQTLASLLLAWRIKQKHPRAVILFGGANVDGEMGFELLKGFDWVDYVVHGEAEHSFPRLLASILSGDHPPAVPGVSWRRNGSLAANFESALPLEDLDECPVPDFSDYFAEVKRVGLDRTHKIRLPVEISRGCWWGVKQHCTFCGLNRDGMAFRQKSAERAHDEILALAREHRCVNLFAVDNILAMTYFRDLLPRLAADDLDLSIFFEVKSNLTRQQVKALAAAGIKSIQPGIESLDDELLKMMGKGVTTIQNLQLLKWTLEDGIDNGWNLLYGFPGETPDHYATLPGLLRLIFHLQPPAGLPRVVFERFSPYHFDCEKYGLELEPKPVYRLIYPRAEIDHRKIAYYFDGAVPGAVADPDSYFEPVRQTVESWRQRWRSDKERPFFYYERGPGFVTLYDNRPLDGKGTSRLRRTVLNEVQSQVYLICDEGRSVAAILSRLADDAPRPPSEAALRRLLGSLVENGFMFGDGDRYLSLATRKPFFAQLGSYLNDL